MKSAPHHRDFMGTPARALVRRVQRSAIAVNSGSLIATTAVTSGLGAGYWWLAAREFPAAAVGLAGAVISAMTLLGVLGTLGFSTALIPRLAARAPGAGALVATALAAVSVVGLALGLAWQVAIALARPDLALTGSSVVAALLFAAGTGLTALTLVLDQALVGLLRGELQLVRNAAFALVKLAALAAAALWLPARGAEVIFATWVVGHAVSLAVLAAVGRPALALPRPRLLRDLRGAALTHHAFNLALSAPGWLLPLLVTALLSATADAYFYTAWTVAGLVFVGPIALTTVLFAVGARGPEQAAAPLRRTLALSFAWGVLAVAGCLAAGSLVLGTFGAAYALRAAPALVVLSLAVFPQVIKLHYVALVRIRGRLGAGILVLLAGGTLEVVLAALGARRGGLTGLAAGWVAAVTVEALAVLPVVVRAAWARVDRPPAASGPARIVMVTPRYRPFTGGVETHVHEVATRLARRGLDVTVLTTDPTGRLPARECQDGVAVVRCRAWPWLGDLHFAPGLFRELRGGAWDLVHVQGVHTLVAPLALLAARRLPRVVSLHSGGHSSALRTALRPLQWSLLRPLLSGCAALIAVSEFEATSFARGLRLPRDGFIVVPNGFALPDCSDAGADPPGPPVVLSIGRLERYKGHHRVIGAMDVVRRAHPDAELHVVGTGPFEPRLRRLAEGRPVRFSSFPPERRAALGGLISRSHLVALLSEYEAHPVAVMEAVGLGRRVLVAANSGLHELAERGLASEVSLGSSDDEIGEAMVELLRRPPPAGRPDLPDWDACAGRLAGVYHDALGAARA
jgi:glycosyltransferase involved in cell wall biosynthesis/O-antigen/teichoic acid export membrane protein